MRQGKCSVHYCLPTVVKCVMNSISRDSNFLCSVHHAVTSVVSSGCCNALRGLDSGTKIGLATRTIKGKLDLITSGLRTGKHIGGPRNRF